MRNSPEQIQQWRERIDAWRASGQKIAEWCRNNQISYDAFIYWRIRLLPKHDNKITKDVFVELPAEQKFSGIHIECRGLQIHLAKEFDLQTLARCIQAIGERLC